MGQVELYQSVLEKLSHIPVEYLQQVDNYLTSLAEKSKKKKSGKEAIKSFAGAWSDMSEEDFQDYLKKAKEVGNELFNRKIDL